MNIEHVRISAAQQDLDQQINALRQEDIAGKFIYIDKKTGPITNGPGHQTVLDQACEGDVIVVYPLGQAGCTHGQ